MRLLVNGEPTNLEPAPASVAELLAQLRLPVEHVAVELNGEIVTRAERAARTVKDGDTVEVVTLVGGG
ncbi:MAG: thiamine biosynthesis protein ThiS [Deltaproteobacteria bacterium RBG_16_71_12]|nr:MAG: thiamine biosynthesis protein ThiS [Deltaproteobacteria bacterium RBG_16_71_12]